MTYCLGIKLKNAIVMVSDSRTSAGVDNISTYSKMWRYGEPGKHQYVLCSAGNLATTQAVISAIEADIKSGAAESLLSITEMHKAAEYIGRVNVDCQNKMGGGPMFESTFLLAGEIFGAKSGLYMIYAQGNFIESSSHVPFMQIGETKYGKPILDRVVNETMANERAALCALISMDATIRSNLTVGPPIEVLMLQIGSLQPGKYLCLKEDDPYMTRLRAEWNKSMQQAVDKMPTLSWGE